MSLEQALAENTEALKQNTAALLAATNAGDNDGDDAATPSKPGRGRPKKDASEKADAKPDKAKKDDDDEPNNLTAEDMRAAVFAYVDEVPENAGDDADDEATRRTKYAKSVLKELGCEKSVDVKKGDRPAFIKALKADQEAYPWPRKASRRSVE